MRIRGNIPPSAVSIEAYAPLGGCVELRLRENVRPLTVTDETSGTGVSMYEYDEYVFHVADRPGLRSQVEADLSNWLATGRALEFDLHASEAADLTDEISAAESDMAALVEMIYESDLEVIG